MKQRIIEAEKSEQCRIIIIDATSHEHLSGFANFRNWLYGPVQFTTSHRLIVSQKSYG